MKKIKVIVRTLAVAVAMLCMVSNVTSTKAYAMDTNAKTYKIENSLKRSCHSDFAYLMPFLSRGDRGDCVTTLQIVLNAWNKYNSKYYLNKDGIFGKATEREVKRFQKSEGLNPDGLVGPGTWRKLEYLFDMLGEDDSWEGPPFWNSYQKSKYLYFLIFLKLF